MATFAIILVLLMMNNLAQGDVKTWLQVTAGGNILTTQIQIDFCQYFQTSDLSDPSMWEHDRLPCPGQRVILAEDDVVKVCCIYFAVGSP